MAEYEFTISDSGIYCFWGKAMGGDPHSNSFIVTVDEEQPVIWEIPVKKDGITAWFKIKSFTNATGEFKLKSGQHKLVIKSREAGARLEAIFIGKKEISPENSQSR
ncbi:MAG: hypothetical protein JXR78_17765 [Victivallales bacterium]|nr:hypothetical protein [Victivallales bacterium]